MDKIAVASVTPITAATSITALAAATRPTREAAEQAVRTLLAWAGDDPTREGLLETPSRVVKAYEEFFNGYGEDPSEILNKTFREVEGYGELVLVRDIPFTSHCEHHMVPFVGKAHVAYLPNSDSGVVGLSKLARLVHAFANRLQVQEKLTTQIVNAIEKELSPRGIAVQLEAEHMCMSMRGVRVHGSSTITERYTGVFEEDWNQRNRIMALFNR